MSLLKRRPDEALPLETGRATPLTIADLVDRLKLKQAALGDPRDVLSTPRAQEAFHNAQALYARTICGLSNAGELAAVEAELADREKQRAIMLAAQASIEEQIASAPDWRLSANGRERDRAWGRMEELKASAKALVNGVEYFDGVPALPGPLRALLGDTIEADGRHVSPWHGCLPAIERRLAELTSRVTELRAALAGHVWQAEQLLAKP